MAVTPEDRALSLSKGVAVRPARPADAAGIARVNTLSWREAYAGLMPEDFLAGLEVPEQLWQQRMAELDSRTVILVAQRGDEIIGFALAGSPPPSEELPAPVGQLYAIYVRAEAWGSGVGYRLHEAVVKALATAGFDSAVLWVLDSNQRAIDFYVRQGWIADGQVRQETIHDLVLDVTRFRLARLPAEG